MILFLGVISLSALALLPLMIRKMKEPPSKRRNLAMTGLIIGFVVATPVLLYILWAIKYLFFAWH